MLNGDGDDARDGRCSNDPKRVEEEDGETAVADIENNMARNSKSAGRKRGRGKYGSKVVFERHKIAAGETVSDKGNENRGDQGQHPKIRRPSRREAVAPTNLAPPLRKNQYLEW